MAMPHCCAADSSLVGLLVKTNLILMSTWKGFEMALDVCGEGPPSGKWSDAWTIGQMGQSPVCCVNI